MSYFGADVLKLPKPITAHRVLALLIFCLPLHAVTLSLPRHEDPARVLLNTQHHYCPGQQAAHRVSSLPGTPALAAQTLRSPMNL